VEENRMSGITNELSVPALFIAIATTVLWPKQKPVPFLI